jgi:uncharacterized phage protein gp47/JayE
MITSQNTQETAEKIVANVEAETSDTIPLLPKAFTRALAKALAGVHVLLYKFAGFIFLQMFVRHASAKDVTILGRTVNPLGEWGALVGAGERLAATRAAFTLDVSVTDQTGTLSKNTQFVRTQTGVVYLSLASVARDAATISVPVRAVSDPNGDGGAGTIGNLVAGDKLQVVSPPAGIVPTAEVATVTTTGAEAESVPAWRQRIADLYQSRPQGGAFSDYRQWAKTVAGIVSVYPYKGAPGEVDVYVEASVASSGSADGIPTGAQLTAVADAIQLNESGLASRRPVGAAINTLAITRSAFDMTVNGLDVDDTPAAEAAITSAVDEFLRTREPFIVGLSVLPRLDRVTEADVSGVVGRVASALGATVASVQLTQGGQPLAAYTLGAGERAKLGTPDFV